VSLKYTVLIFSVLSLPGFVVEGMLASFIRRIRNCIDGVSVLHFDIFLSGVLYPHFILSPSPGDKGTSGFLPHSLSGAKTWIVEFVGAGVS